MGSTVDVKARKSQYAHEGYSGTMSYARTENMKKAEDKVLGKRKFRDNEQRHSNNKEKPGYVYAIKETKKGKRSARK